jgi:hypothetical protein
LYEPALLATASGAVFRDMSGFDIKEELKKLPNKPGV